VPLWVSTVRVRHVVMDEFTSEGMTIIEHVSEAWRFLLQLPGAEHGRVSDYLGGHYDWSEVEGDETAMWRASLASTRRTMAPGEVGSIVQSDRTLTTDSDMR
jgi:hypothetical protein